MVRISLVVPTFNRAQYLKKSLPSFINQSLNKDLYEILVIDNNSSDNTRSVIHDILDSEKCSWYYIFEQRQGLHFARNRGILEAQGDIIVFGDDDIIADQRWLESILSEFDEHQKTGVVGGKILPEWEGVPPQWIYDYGDEKIHTIFAYLDYGIFRKVLRSEYVFGCNFSIRRDLAVKIGGSSPDTFPKNLKHLSGRGECDMIDRVRELGFDVLYLSEAFVHHHASASRATLAYFVDRYERFAIEDTAFFFAKYTRLGAAVFLLKRSLINLCVLYRAQLVNYMRLFLNVKLLPIGKIHPQYFLIIQKKFNKQVLWQVVRVFLFPSLCRAIRTRGVLRDN